MILLLQRKGSYNNYFCCPFSFHFFSSAAYCAGLLTLKSTNLLKSTNPLLPLFQSPGVDWLQFSVPGKTS